ncbi:MULTISPECIES: response regulator [unclassified Cupriavidus]|uniref:response regulator n=1 Tax=unclassified Cupriavidus TaxID=2640874 RepID=UPI001C001FE0|nr:MULTISPECIES: response regulator transcription factor [unclassified Cupriavidus]MCA3194115.1 response regulator transcription factor [Cupriavidus sp.]MCA3199244.1 response regulator transcription factor [Cupriavidus sp.]MCA3209692.1 response regulator transcription factor [Cupriavidus sp.]MCA3233200.1 response regulator transcription factor [Cupriavidus sp.]QWE97139.1 response regulator transcription factor [Cupriavidus sp. EM10]
MIRVVIADDHAVVRNGLRHILEREDDVEVVGEAAKGSEVPQVLRETTPDVILLDLSMPGRSGLELVRHVRTEYPASRVLVLTMHAEEQYVVRAFRAGAAGYLTKDSAANDLIAALRKVATGGTYVSPEMAEKLALGVQEQTDAPHASLSDRELEVYRRIVNGESLTEIAEALCVSAKTVSTYKMRLLEKLQLRSDAALVRYAIEANLFPRESPL